MGWCRLVVVWLVRLCRLYDKIRIFFFQAYFLLSSFTLFSLDFCSPVSQPFASFSLSGWKDTRDVLISGDPEKIQCIEDFPEL